MAQTRREIADGRLTAAQATSAFLQRTAARNGDGGNGLHAYLQVFDQDAMRRAQEIDARIEHQGAAAVGPLAGVPVAIKDNMCSDFGRTTCASKFLEHYESPYTGTAVQRLLDAGAVILGKTNLDEFAMGSSTEHSAFGPSRNPWATNRTPGGSSGGSAAAVAGRLCSMALGSDTGGSIRQPAAHCGIVGLKPTYGRVSRWGLVAFASSLDQIGPMTHNVQDAAIAMEAIQGFDPMDATSANREAETYTESLEKPVQGLTVAVPKQAFHEHNHKDVTETFERSVQVARAMGATIVQVDMPCIDYAIAAYYVIAPAEASSNLARFDGVRYGKRARTAPGDSLEDMYQRSRSEGFGPEVKRRIMLGTYALSSGYYDAYYNTALKARRTVKDAFDEVFNKGAHAVMLPTTPEPASELKSDEDPIALYLEDKYTVAANLAGLPAISVPAGCSTSKGVDLPVGVQLYGPAFGEGRLLRVARSFEARVQEEGLFPGCPAAAMPV